MSLLLLLNGGDADATTGGKPKGPTWRQRSEAAQAELEQREREDEEALILLLYGASDT